MAAGKWSRALGLLFGVVSLGFVLMVATVPLPIALVASGAAVWWLGRATERHAVTLVAATLLTVTALVELTLRLLPQDASPQYFRPHEVLGGHEFEGGMINYRPNQRLEDFEIPYGGLANLSPLVATRQPRVVDFVTDSLGFRNRADYAGQAFALFGDSFAAGTANTQDAILSEILTNEHGIPVYNAAYPASEIGDYIARLRMLEGVHGARFRAIVLVFEGNDFRCRSAERTDRGIRWHRGLQYIPGSIRSLESYRALYGLTRRAYHLHLAGGAKQEDLTVLVERVGEENVAFLKSYVEKVTAPEACSWEEQRSLFESAAGRIALLVFMPTKYRVYRSLARRGGESTEPSPASAFMHQLSLDLKVPYLDLTAPLVSASEALLKQGQYTFWLDDTHWNPNGIRVAAAAIADRLRAEGLVSSSGPTAMPEPSR